MAVQRSAVAFRFSSFSQLPLRHAMSGRLPDAPHEGSIGHARDTVDDDVEANRHTFMDAATIDLEALTLGRQTHGSTVQVVTAEHRGRGMYPVFDGFPETDALVTDDPSVAIGVVVADCVPILLYDSEHHAVGVVHAGWRGTVGNIAGATVETMTRAYGTRPERLVAGIGPSIGPCCYEVGEDVVGAWLAAELTSESAVVRVDSGYHFDLWTANRKCLVAAGVPRRSIEDSGLCTRCRIDRFFSYRGAKQGLLPHGRMLLAAQLDA